MKVYSFHIQDSWTGQTGFVTENDLPRSQLMHHVSNQFLNSLADVIKWDCEKKDQLFSWNFMGCGLLSAIYYNCWEINSLDE